MPTKKVLGALVLGATLFHAQAQAACWSAAEVSAAKVRDLETMLMVSSLRCRLTGHNMIGDYNQLVARARPTLAAANETLRAHFVAVAGERGGLDAYDRYVTAMANRYGAGAEGMNCKSVAAILDSANDAHGSVAGLVRLADESGVEPELRGGRCAETLAARK